MRTPITVAATLLVLGILENIAFGQDQPGTAHDVSLACFFVWALSAITLLGLLAIALTRRLRRQRVR